MATSGYCLPSSNHSLINSSKSHTEATTHSRVRTHVLCSYTRITTEQLILIMVVLRTIIEHTLREVVTQLYFLCLLLDTATSLASHQRRLRMAAALCDLFRVSGSYCSWLLLRPVGRLLAHSLSCLSSQTGTTKSVALTAAQAHKCSQMGKRTLMMALFMARTFESSRICLHVNIGKLDS